MSEPEAFKTIVEGSTTMCYPADQDSEVFYNPVQVQNRDLSILMITLANERRAVRKAVTKHRKHLKKAGVSGQDMKDKLAEFEEKLDPSQALKDEESGIAILDALAASGLRSLRYWQEIPNVRHVTINDLEPAAVARAHLNVKYNKLDDVLIPDNSDRKRGICIQTGDATHEMYNSRRRQSPTEAESNQKSRWDVIDLDPYGSAAPFLDSAIQAIETGGLLCVTCTDMAALGGAHPETCYGRYASMPIQRAGYLQELALRILLYSMATSAARYGRSIKPILSVGMNFYIRVFCEVYDSKAAVKDLSLSTGLVYQSKQCASFHIQPSGGKSGNRHMAGVAPAPASCEETGGNFKIGGPIWLGPLHDPDVVQEAIKRLESKRDGTFPDKTFIATTDRLRGLLSSCVEELPTPLYYVLPQICQTLKVSAPSLITIKAGLLNAGYKVSGYHKEPSAIKTDAPSSVLWDVLRAYCKENPPKNIAPGSAVEKILSKDPSITVDFTVPESLKRKNANHVARFPQNPEKHWGPKKAATGKRKASEIENANKTNEQ